jgi:hypothetical protein
MIAVVPSRVGCLLLLGGGAAAFIRIPPAPGRLLGRWPAASRGSISDPSVFGGDLPPFVRGREHLETAGTCVHSAYPVDAGPAVGLSGGPSSLPGEYDMRDWLHVFRLAHVLVNLRFGDAFRSGVITTYSPRCQPLELDYEIADIQGAVPADLEGIGGVRQEGACT